MLKKIIPGITFKEKPLTADIPIEILPTPRKVYIPFCQHQGRPARPIIKVGDSVKIGTKIGEMDGEFSANVHSSVTGKVIAITEHPHPILGTSLCCIIETSESDEWERNMNETNDYNQFSQEKLIAIIKDAGIVGLGGGMFPTHIKLSPPPEKKINLLIINGCESEPMITADYRLMLEYLGCVLEGSRIIQKIVGAERVVFAVQKNKKEVGILLKKEGANVVILDNRYPLGAERQLIRAITNQEIPQNMLPWDWGYLVQNVATCYACFQTVKFNKPLIERVITVTGDGIKEPKNLLVKIGTPVKDIINFCGGYNKGIKKIVFGGPMTGIAQFSLAVPIIKGILGIIIFSNSAQFEEYTCVRCGNCVDVCPMGILPCKIYQILKQGNINLLEDYGISVCLECGSCAYVCPSHIPLVHYFKIAKLKLKKLSQKRK